MNNKGVMWGVVIVILLLIGYFAFMRDDAHDMNMDTMPTATENTSGENEMGSTPNTTGSPTGGVSGQVTGSVTGEVGTVKTFTVTGDNFSFSPTNITVNKGDKVRIIFKNVEGTHNFIIDELKVNSGVLTGAGEKTFEFTATQSGSFEYYCSIGKHREMGMKGTFTVK